MSTQEETLGHLAKVILADLIIKKGQHEKNLKRLSSKRERDAIKSNPERLAIKREKNRIKMAKRREKISADPIRMAEERRKISNWSKKNYAKKRATDPEFVEYHRKRIREYNKTEKGREVQRKQMAKCRENLQFRLAAQCRSRICDALRGNRKSSKTESLIGCTIPELMLHLESQFKPGMSWDNWGNGIGKWNIDHTAPCASFDLSNPDQQKKCFHYSNLQPLWAIENSAKNSIVDGVKAYYLRPEIQ